MEELHQAALAYYNNGSQNLQLLAANFFRSMDGNGDGRVSKSEFITFLQQNGYGWINPSFFNNLDRNHDGGLDFEEVLTFYYIIKTRNLWCDGCGVCLKGLYFTCVECFDRAANTYDLCSRCYSSRRFRHNHTCFLDNHMLLRSKRTQLRQAGLPNLNLVITPARQIFYPPATPARNRLRQTFQALEAAITVANLITLCTIM
ncbi:PREDICTED: Calcium-binding EF-hand [Prunus dulcis]|uniref:PREDICTED: Calcium-binding EF-hand n=1 Tax=Prunus dulcis TaxID=3755 RepID=A0A5E4FGG3_PRUDU|nr:uncharacterized protein LOC117625240 [Prunus dulcis]VVA27016.1 PREDICTED: Calcium-binding EF-hand [Prunus dulcis]